MTNRSGIKEILIITGACGVGKSTIAQEWAKGKNGAAIDCDYLTEWIHSDHFPHWTEEEERFVAKVTAKMAIEYINFGLSTALENVWSPLGIEFLVKEILSTSIAKIKVVWLYCELSENLKRDQTRIPENQMLERVNIVNEELVSYNWPDYLVKIDTTKLSIEETIQAIEDIEPIF